MFYRLPYRLSWPFVLNFEDVWVWSVRRGYWSLNPVPSGYTAEKYENATNFLIFRPSPPRSQRPARSKGRVPKLRSTKLWYLTILCWRPPSWTLTLVFLLRISPLFYCKYYLNLSNWMLSKKYFFQIWTLKLTAYP